MPLCSDECDRAATLYCAKCELYWCDACSEEAHARRAFKSHNPQRIPDAQTRSTTQQQQQQQQQYSHSQAPHNAASASASSVARSLAGLSLAASPAASAAPRWFSARTPLPSLPTPPRPVLIVVDWLSFVWVVRRSSLGMFVRTLTQLAHDLGRTPVTKLLFLMDPAPIPPVHEPNPRAREVAAEMQAFFIEQMQLAWDGTAAADPSDTTNSSSSPRLLGHKLHQLRQRTDGFDSGSLTIFASSRPQLFRPLLDGWLSQGRHLALVHGHNKLAHSLPAHQLQSDERRPSDLYQLGLEVATKLRSEAQSSASDGLSIYLHRTLSTAFTLITSTWPSDSSSKPGSPPSLAAILRQTGTLFLPQDSLIDRQHLSQLVGAYCVWDLPPWHESYEQPPAAGVEARVLPAHGCPLWNAERPCASSPCPQAHHCQACGQLHRLAHCPVNSFLGPVQPLSTRRDLSRADLLAFMRWYGDTYALLRFHSCFRVWKLPLREQLTRAQLLLLPSAVLQQSPSCAHPDGLLPSEALVYIDWQNIKVPIYAIEAFMTGLRQFAQAARPGVRGVRAIHVLLDRDKKGDVGEALDRLARTGALPIHVVHVEARKVQAVDSRLTLMLRTEPRAFVPGKQQADLVCVVSGDSDFSPDMSRLVLLGHRVLLVYNTQARPSFKQNALWEAAVDFMDLPELASYRAAQMKLRADRKRMAQSALQQGISTRVSSMVLHGGDLRARLPGLNGVCMDYEGRALLLTDEVQNRLWRFVLLTGELAALDMRRHRSAEAKTAIRAAREIQCKWVKDPRDVLKGTLELLVDEQTTPVHYIVCLDNSQSMEPYWTQVREAMSALHQRLKEQSSSNLVSLLVYNTATSALQDEPLPVGNMPLDRLPRTHADGYSNLRTLFTHVHELVSMQHAPLTEVLLVAEPTNATKATYSMLQQLLNKHVHCTFVCPRAMIGSAQSSSERAEEAEFKDQLSQAGASLLQAPSSPSAHPLSDAVQRFVDDVSQRTSSRSLSRPEGVVVDPNRGLVFVCDVGHNRIAVLDRDTQRMRTLLPSESPRVSRPHPRHLFLDTTRQRLWITDVSTQQLGFYDLRRLSVLDGSTAVAPYRAVPLPSVSCQPTSKCLAANQSDLVYCDQRRRAFFLLTETKPSRQVGAGAGAGAGSSNVQDDGVVFVSSLLYEWKPADSNELRAPVSAPLPSYHSLQLDRDGSYLFADSTSNTIKRLVSLRDSAAHDEADDEDERHDDAESSHWEVRLVAGKGPGGYTDGEAHEARFQFPATLVVDPLEVGSVFIAERGNRALRKLHVAHEAAEGGSGSSNSDGPPAHGYSRNLQARAEMARSRWKTRPCKPFQSGECRFQAESDKCGFIHECVQCGGPHGERDCPHKLLQHEHPYLTFTSADGGDPSGRAKEPVYSCQICSEPCGTLALAAQHVESRSHRDKQRQLRQLVHDIGSEEKYAREPPVSVDAAHVHDQPADADQADPEPDLAAQQHEWATRVHTPSPPPTNAAKSSYPNFVPVNPTGRPSLASSAGRASLAASQEEPAPRHLMGVRPLSNSLFGHTHPPPMPAGPTTIRGGGWGSTATTTSPSFSPAGSPAGSLASSLTGSPALGDTGGSSASASSSPSFRCDICNMNFNSRSQMDQHEQGRSHRTRSARFAAGMPLSTPRCSPGSSPTRSVDPSPPCPCCLESFQALAGSPDRRPRVLPCGHSLCSSCASGFDRCPICRHPFDASVLPINLHLVHIIESSAQKAVEHERRRAEAERQYAEQHNAFQRSHPFMQCETARSTSKEPRYTCTICDVLAGPIHRALAHANTAEHKAKQQQQQQQKQSQTRGLHDSQPLAGSSPPSSYPPLHRTSTGASHAYPQPLLGPTGIMTGLAAPLKIQSAPAATSQFMTSTFPPQYQRQQSQQQQQQPHFPSARGHAQPPLSPCQSQRSVVSIHSQRNDAHSTPPRSFMAPELFSASSPFVADADASVAAYVAAADAAYAANPSSFSSPASCPPLSSIALTVDGVTYRGAEVASLDLRHFRSPKHKEVIRLARFILTGNPNTPPSKQKPQQHHFKQEERTRTPLSTTASADGRQK